MSKVPERLRVLIYSHDSFGLGHLRRCRAIAHAMVGAVDNLAVLILSGLPIIGSFDFRARVDFVRVPGVIKLRNGEYSPLNPMLGIEQTMALRSSIMRHTADIFDPDIFLVDKEPLGLRGEVRETIDMLKERGTRIILSLRDVMDDPELLKPEWERKNAVPALSDLYDEIWVYGLPQIHDPLAEIELPDSVRRKVVYTGYLKRTVPELSPEAALPEAIEEPFVLVTTGGGGDGDFLVDRVLAAYESAMVPELPALVVFGPFIQPEVKTDFQTRVDRLERVSAITFETHLESLIARAAGVVAMGGLQHVLRDPVIRQAGAHRSKTGAAPRADHPGQPRPRTRSCLHADRGGCGPGRCDGDGNSPAPATATFRPDRGSRTPRRPGECQSAGRDASRRKPDKPTPASRPAPAGLTVSQRHGGGRGHSAPATAPV